MTVAGNEDADPSAPEPLGQRPVRGDDPGPMADGRVQDRRIAPTVHGERRELPRQCRCGAGFGNPSGGEPLELFDHGSGHYEVRPWADPFDLRL
jgi:hypothetical protein